MKIILSPSKLQSKGVIFDRRRQPLSEQRATFLKNQLKAMPYAEIKSFFGLKEPMAKSVYEQIHSVDVFVSDVFSMYSGIVFKEINVASYDRHQLDYLVAHGVVLSALYGVLEADMAVQNYRLDMTKKIAGLNLYDYWQDLVDDYFGNVATVVNLASREFSRMLKHYRGRMLNIHFVEEQSTGKLKVVTVRAKQARGLMFDYMVSNCIERIDDIKYFREAGYCYAEKLSKENDWYFVKHFDD